jgi:hypothetical protein
MPLWLLSYLPATLIIDPGLTSGACWPSEFVLVRLESQEEQYGVILTLGTHGGEGQRREGKHQSQQVRKGRMIGWSVLVGCWRPTPDCSTMMMMTMLM